MPGTTMQMGLWALDIDILQLKNPSMPDSPVELDVYGNRVEKSLCQEILIEGTFLYISLPWTN